MERASFENFQYDWQNFTIYSFVEYLNTHHQYNIDLVPFDLPPKLFGAWLTRRGVNYLFYSKKLPPLHQAHVILHELGHLLSGHKTYELTDQDIQKFSTGDVSIFQHAKQRSNKDATDPKEIEAEKFAIDLQEKVIFHTEFIILGEPETKSYKEMLNGLGLLK